MKFWIEKTYSHKRILNKEGQFKKVLLSPARSKNNADIYKSMRDIEIGDIIIHLDQSKDAFIGQSIVISKLEEITIEDRDYYRIKLEKFTPYIPDINIREFFINNNEVLQEIKRDYNKLFYIKYINRDIISLRQGAYLTEAIPPLMDLLKKYIKRSKNMETQTVREVPIELLNTNNDISIIIGKNGTGKSQLLRNLVFEYLRKNKHVIAISSSIYDKFSDISKKDLKEFDEDKYHFLGAKTGPKTISKTIEKCIYEKKNFNKFLEFLKLIDYQDKIGLKLNINNLTKKDRSNINEKNNIFINEYKFLQNNDEILWIRHSNNITEAENFINSVNKLTAEKLNISFDFFLSRNNLDIPLSHASSGELTLISIFTYILNHISSYGSVILIDEPENSLHPQWQKDFIKTLINFFSEYNSKIIIATHSPILISVSEFLDNQINIFVSEKKSYKKLLNNSLNHETLLREVFNIITPENRSLSNELVDLLNELDEGTLIFEDFNSKISNYKNFVYDVRQIELLDGIYEIGCEIDSKK
ncbi:AAA family ATPase [Arcobacter roscoffensis]|uniref:ATP-binding protein n=1 Tax=Arcobacter roscoffensis TaxID=2961520 RepID=A0ABY5E3I5_9BACT|nr:AAA family ATPase [Arcobacter roscoffensis]UTJ06719.1 ATP-binding protein [Arcobacter roscoffensis]